MAKIQPTVLETGIFPSPATHGDAPYQLWQQPNGDLTVVCLESRTHHPVSVLSEWTHEQIGAQRRAFIREIAAWFDTNGPANTTRSNFAVAEVERMLAAHYSKDDLEADRAWIETHDLSLRVPILRDSLPEAARREIIDFCGRVATAGDGITQSDAQFIEILGKGLGLDPDAVTSIVVAAMQTHAQAAA